MFLPNFKKQDGLVPAIVQDAKSGEVLMVAYMNEDAYKKTLETGNACYYSRSRGKFWMKGEESGNIQKVKEILVDCDDDTLVLRIEQVGDAACHTGHRSCFYRKVVDGKLIEFDEDLLFDPEKVYKK